MERVRVSAVQEALAALREVDAWREDSATDLERQATALDAELAWVLRQQAELAERLAELPRRRERLAARRRELEEDRRLRLAGLEAPLLEASRVVLEARSEVWVHARAQAWRGAWPGFEEVARLQAAHDDLQATLAREQDLPRATRHALQTQADRVARQLAPLRARAEGGLELGLEPEQVVVLGWRGVLCLPVHPHTVLGWVRREEDLGLRLAMRTFATLLELDAGSAWGVVDGHVLLTSRALHGADARAVVDRVAASPELRCAGVEPVAVLLPDERPVPTPPEPWAVPVEPEPVPEEPPSDRIGLHLAARRLRVHPLDLLRMLHARGGLTEDLRLAADQLHALRTGADIVTWWRAGEPHFGLDPAGDLARALEGTLRERAPGGTRADNLLRGLDPLRSALACQALEELAASGSVRVDRGALGAWVVPR